MRWAHVANTRNLRDSCERGCRRTWFASATGSCPDPSRRPRCGRHNGAVSSATPTSPVPVLIFGAHIAALGVLRVLASHRIPTFVVDDTTNVIIRSRWYRAPGRTLAETADSAILAEYLRGLDIERAVLIPCSDQWAVAVAGLPDDLKARFPASLPPRGAVEDFVDKDRFRGLTDRLDLPRPRSIPISRRGRSRKHRRCRLTRGVPEAHRIGTA